MLPTHSFLRGVFVNFCVLLFVDRNSHNYLPLRVYWWRHIKPIRYTVFGIISHWVFSPSTHLFAPWMNRCPARSVSRRANTTYTTPQNRAPYCLWLAGISAGENKQTSVLNSIVQRTPDIHTYSTQAGVKSLRRKQSPGTISETPHCEVDQRAGGVWLNRQRAQQNNGRWLNFHSGKTR